MCPAKKQDSSSLAPAWLRGLFAWLLGAGRPMLILAVLVGVLGGGTYYAWRRLRTRILSASEYRVGPEQVQITPPPAWIHSDVRAEAFRDPALGGPLWLMDDDLLDRIKRAFEGCPWVAKVSRVAKRHPASVQVELVYRQPVCMVQVPRGVLAVDAEGVVLPSEDFSPVEAARYPQLTGVGQKPSGPAGRRWIDAKVAGGAEIAAALGPAWDAMNLKRIEALDADPAAGTALGGARHRPGEPLFALLTHRGTRILWGYGPGANVVGEIPAVVKVARLKQYLAKHDTLDGPQGQPQRLDVRTMDAPAAGGN